MRCARVEQIENSICGGGCLEGIKSKCFDMFTGAVDVNISKHFDLIPSS